jgi:hypothetical protein
VTRLHLQAAAAAIVLAVVLLPNVISAAGRNPFLVVDGDGWLASNANHDAGRWTAPNPARPAFGLQLSERNDLPFDRGTAGATFWVRNANCGVAFAAFSDACGWQLGLAVTQYRSVVVGGHGIEIDGLGANPPYGRVVNSMDGNSRVVGLLTNEYVDFSGVDSQREPSWFAGFDLGRDGFVVRRRKASGAGFDELLSVDRDGDLAVRRSAQQAPNQWATRARLVHGRYTFNYATAFEQTPVCVATTEGSAPLRVMPTTQFCAISSHDPADTSTIDVMVIGNPR